MEGVNALKFAALLHPFQEFIIMKKITFLSLILFFCGTTFLSAQKEATSLHKTFEFKDEKPQDLTFKLKVDETSQEVSFGLEGKISNGWINVVLYDPKGKKVSKLGLKTKKGGTCKGTLEEATDQPLPGVWEVKIKGENLNGKIKVTFNQQ